MEAIVKRLELQFEDKSVVLQSDVPNGLPPVQSDEDRISQVMLNLGGNALQYTPGGGRVRRTAIRHEDEIYISITDTGIGIPAEHLENLFTRFYRIDKSRPG